ncbi:MAG: ATP-binding protein [Candidatus Melainabacteria bacterium]|nr:ATP-binding protein [Candidatus Melainabacteria bacterium]
MVRYLMMYEFIIRSRLETLKKNLDSRKVNVILGIRRSGKTSLLEKFLEAYEHKYLFLNGDDIQAQGLLSGQSITQFQNLLAGYKLLVIDEAQQVPNIGLNLKLIIDHIKDVTVLVTGSSLFDLDQKLGEPLTGRKKIFKLFTIAQLELNAYENPMESSANLDNRLVYGSYPEVVTAINNHEKEIYLREIVNSYLLKDILVYDGIKNSNKIYKILQLLAYQVGKEVAFDELATHVSMSKNTVEKYLDLLEKNFILYKLSSFSSNPRKELSKKKRFYFHDNGIRNALINNFNPLSIRNDVGELWENYIFYERMKFLEYNDVFVNRYFWRTYDQQEIDLVEEKNQCLSAFEVKYSSRAKYKFSKYWLEHYPEAVNQVIHKDNYMEFIS